LNWFSRFGIPFLAYGGMACQRVPNLVGVPDVWDVRQAKEDFLAHCRRARIRRVLQISFCAGPSVDMLPAFRRAGIEAEGWLVPPVKGISRQEGIREAVRSAVAKRFADARSLPDLVFFTDDFVAAGGLLALAQCGVRVPEDVRVVTLANEGDLPVSMCSLTCILSSPVERGVLMARRVLAALSSTRLPTGADSVPKISYRIGESFPDK
jgi:DNA-binding LacI/PurR family transcriptional regulator